MEQLKSLTQTMRHLANARHVYLQTDDGSDPQFVVELTKQIKRTIANGGALASKALSDANIADEVLGTDDSEAINEFYAMRGQVQTLLNGPAPEEDKKAAPAKRARRSDN